MFLSDSESLIVQHAILKVIVKSHCKQTAGHFDVVRYAQGQKNALATTALNKGNESDVEEKPVRRETSLRRKVQKQRVAPHTHVERYSK